MSLLVPLLGQSVPEARLRTLPRQYQGPRLLRDLVTEVTAKFGWRISYEEPPWLATADAKPMFNPATRLPGPHMGMFELPEGKLNLTAILAQKHASPADFLAASLDAYRGQGNRGGFRVQSENGMLQILPDSASSVVREAGDSLLDTVVSVPVAKRLPLDHLNALCKAIEQARGIACEANDSAFGGSFNVSYLAGPIEKTEWGTTSKKARQALVEFLSLSMTTTTWQVCCQPEEDGTRACFLSVLPIIVEVETSKGRVRKPIYNDRGWRFPFPPPPPPPESN